MPSTRPSTGVGTFLWAEDQALRLCIDPKFQKDRWGADEPDELLDVMRRIGSHLWSLPASSSRVALPCGGCNPVHSR
ncbi:DUF6461 domain-containing protein [Actinacidiphila sp. bgisy167]|uniref:DUF6461 domain-containing protein n=1 Tax=Actinacidiphila sp. bgisy167 TaxID=3413797 RepID=UPI003D74C080